MRALFQFYKHLAALSEQLAVSVLDIRVSRAMDHRFGSYANHLNLLRGSTQESIWRQNLVWVLSRAKGFRGQKLGTMMVLGMSRSCCPLLSTGWIITAVLSASANVSSPRE